MQYHTDLTLSYYIAADEDYKSVSLILEFLPGETEKKIKITIINDKKIERDEFFQLYLSAGEGVHLTPFARTEITIINNDGKYVHVNCHKSKFVVMVEELHFILSNHGSQLRRFCV